MLKKITLLIIYLPCMLLCAQNVTTVTAGNFYDSIGQDSQGTIYCSDYFGDSVFKYDTNGNVSVFKNGFSNPNGIDVNAQDEIFICDAGANVVSKYSTSGTLLATYTQNISGPTGIRAIAGTTDVLLVEYTTNSLKRLAQDGTVTTLFSGFPLNGPSGIAFIDGQTYISNFNDRKIMRFENGNMTMITQLPADGPNNNFLGFITASNSVLYATQWGAQRIYSIDPITGNTNVYAGSTIGNTDGDISVAQFNFPNGIYADIANDRLYVSDAGTSNLRIINNALLSTDDFTKNDIAVNLIVDRLNDTLKVSANLNSTTPVSIKLFEITGKEVIKKNDQPTNTAFTRHIGIKNIRSGVYILLFAQGGKVTRKKLLL